MSQTHNEFFNYRNLKLRSDKKKGTASKTTQLYTQPGQFSTWIKLFIKKKD